MARCTFCQTKILDYDIQCSVGNIKQEHCCEVPKLTKRALSRSLAEIQQLRGPELERVVELLRRDGYFGTNKDGVEVDSFGCLKDYLLYSKIRSHTLSNVGRAIFEWLQDADETALKVFQPSEDVSYQRKFTLTATHLILNNIYTKSQEEIEHICQVQFEQPEKPPVQQMYESLHRALSGTSFSKFTDRTQTGKYTIQMLLTALFTSDTNHNQRNNQATDDGVQEGLNHFEIALLLQDNRYIDNILSKEDAIELSRMISDWGGDEPGDEPQQAVEDAPALTKDAVGPTVSDSTVEWEKAQDEFLQQLEGAISDQSDDSPAADSQGEKLVLNNLRAFSNNKRTTHAGDKKLKFNTDKAKKLLETLANSSELSSPVFDLLSYSQDEIKCVYFSNSIDDEFYESLIPTLSLDACHLSLNNSQRYKDDFRTLYTIVGQAGSKGLVPLGMMLSKNAECGLEWFTFLYTFFKKNGGSHWKKLRESLRLHDDSITEESIPPLQIISEQDKGIKKALDMLRTRCGVPIESFACSKHVQRNLSKYTIAKHRRVMQHNFFQLIFESDPEKIPPIQETMRGGFFERHKRETVNSTYNLITNMYECARGLQLYNLVTPRFDIMTSNHCEILNAEIYAFRRLNPINLIVKVLSIQCDKVKFAESMTFDWNTVRQMPQYDDEMNDASDFDDGNDSDDASDFVDEEDEPEYTETLTNYGYFLYSTTIITSSCLNSKETSVTVDESSPETQMTTHKHSVSWDCGLSLRDLLAVLRVYAKKMRKCDSFINFRAYVYHQLRARTAVVTEKRCTISQEGKTEEKSTYSCSHCRNQAYTFFECPHITCVKMRRVLNGHALIPSMAQFAKHIIYEDSRKRHSNYTSPIFEYQSCFSKANRCIIRRKTSQTSRSAVRQFDSQILLKAIHALKDDNKTMNNTRGNTRKRQRIACSSDRISSPVEKKKRGRGRPRKSEQKRNYKARKLTEEAKADPMNSHPT
ncbi:unnamed protein product [Cyberlindnera jadinii]|uniref:MULE transposase domain-containing protein n=1 Tax=Cyberlindnera jadinii (strain ATCC 18201 / CBS 1600 / BCRC 20928 / JCM 3617 / NBRC 0987 / NRRL Y-1542) TaxID=983966 RepID=A0A0H5C822_CYBJN|nr:unnamed protein product [Cyberlindnera jadinii]